MQLRRGIISSGLDDGPVGNFNTLQMDIGKTLFKTDDPSLDVTNVTYGGWFYIDSAGTNTTQYMLNRRFGSSGPWTSRYLDAGNKLVSFQANGGGDNYLEYVLPSPEDTWHFYLGSYDGTTNQLYVDGADVASNTALSGNLLSSALRVQFGRQSGHTISTQDFQGNVGPMFMFDEALSLSEKNTIYNAGLGIQPEDLPTGIKNKFVIAWPLNDGVVDPYVDRSTNGNDASTGGSPVITTPTLEFS